MLSQVLELPLREAVFVLPVDGVPASVMMPTLHFLFVPDEGINRRKQLIHLHCFNGSEDLIWHNH